MILFETQRLYLRNVMPCDLDIMFDYRNNEICARYQRGQTKTYEGIEELVQRRKDDEISIENPFMLAVALKCSNEMIGEIVVMPNENTFSLGYTFSYKYHRQGYAYEALTVLIEFLHEKYTDWEFISFTDPDNRASMGLLTKLGYKDLGYLPSKESQVFGKWITESTEEEITQVSLNMEKRNAYTRDGKITDIRLVPPSMEYDADIMQLRQEFADANDADSFAGCGSLSKCTTTQEWLQRLEEMESEETAGKKGLVPANTYLAVRNTDNRIVGVTDLRHHIDHPVLGLWGGHIGYSVRPSERGRGYAKEILRLILRKCRERNMEKVMVTCNKENLASESVILAQGGVFEKEVLVDGEYIKRYWINI